MTVNIQGLNIGPIEGILLVEDHFLCLLRNSIYYMLVTADAVLVCSGSFWNYRQRERERFRFQRVNVTPLGFQRAEWLQGVSICTKYLSMRNV
jgi:hypothetical protein